MRLAQYGVRQPCCRECSSARPVSAGWPVLATLLYPPPHRRTHLTPATRTTCTPKMPWQRNDCRFWSAAAMLPRVLVRQCGQRRMACTGHPAAPLLTAERISHRPREQRVRQKCPGSEMIAVFGVRQPCCRECSSGNAVSAGWRVPATLPPPSSPPNASHTGHANNVYAKNALAAK